MKKKNELIQWMEIDLIIRSSKYYVL